MYIYRCVSLQEILNLLNSWQCIIFPKTWVQQIKRIDKNIRQRRACPTSVCVLCFLVLSVTFFFFTYQLIQISVALYEDHQVIVAVCDYMNHAQLSNAVVSFMRRAVTAVWMSSCELPMLTFIMNYDTSPKKQRFLRNDKRVFFYFFASRILLMLLLAPCLSK